MFPINAHDVMLLVAAILGLLGVIAVVSGFFLLIRQATSSAVQSIANQAANLAQKGIAEEVAGLVGNARGLVDALNQLVRTAAGIGIFLVVSGFIMLLVAFILVRQI